MGVNIYHCSPIPRWIIVLVYTKPVDTQHQTVPLFWEMRENSHVKSRKMPRGGRWIADAIPSLSSQSGRAIPYAIHWFGTSLRGRRSKGKGEGGSSSAKRDRGIGRGSPPTTHPHDRASRSLSRFALELPFSLPFRTPATQASLVYTKIHTPYSMV